MDLYAYPAGVRPNPVTRPYVPKPAVTRNVPQESIAIMRTHVDQWLAGKAGYLPIFREIFSGLELLATDGVDLLTKAHHIMEFLDRNRINSGTLPRFLAAAARAREANPQTALGIAELITNCLKKSRGQEVRP